VLPDTCVSGLAQCRALSLALLEFRVLLVDDVQFAFAAHNLAVNRAFLNGWLDFHCLVFI
jgi:hypothetical protein